MGLDAALSPRLLKDIARFSNAPFQWSANEGDAEDAPGTATILGQQDSWLRDRRHNKPVSEVEELELRGGCEGRTAIYLAPVQSTVGRGVKRPVCRQPDVRGARGGDTRPETRSEHMDRRRGLPVSTVIVRYIEDIRRGSIDIHGQDALIDREILVGRLQT